MLLGKRMRYKLTIVKDLGMRPTKSGKQICRFCIAKCFCGKEFEVRTHSIKSKHTKSCGCARYIKKENAIYEEPEYWVYSSMNRRCYNKSYSNYKNYGGRGITVCKEWKKDAWNFFNWARANGYKKGLQLDRKDNDKGYSPENCRFVTSSVNSQNTRLLSSRNKSGYRGISKQGRKWIAQIRDNKKNTYLGTHLTKELAAQAYNDYVIENKTEHPLNIIKKLGNK